MDYLVVTFEDILLLYQPSGMDIWGNGFVLHDQDFEDVWTAQTWLLFVLTDAAPFVVRCRWQFSLLLGMWIRVFRVSWGLRVARPVCVGRISVKLYELILSKYRGNFFSPYQADSLFSYHLKFWALKGFLELSSFILLLVFGTFHMLLLYFLLRVFLIAVIV